MHSETNNFIEKTLRSGLGDRADDEKDKDDDDEAQRSMRLCSAADHIAAEEAQSFSSKLKGARGRRELSSWAIVTKAKITTMSRELWAGEDEDESGYVRGPGSTRLGLAQKQTRGRYTGRF